MEMSANIIIRYCLILIPEVNRLEEAIVLPKWGLDVKRNEESNAERFSIGKTV